MTSQVVWSAGCLAFLLLAACNGGGGVDAGDDVHRDSGGAPLADAGAGGDAGHDAGGVGTEVDAGLDAGLDAGTDAGPTLNGEWHYRRDIASPSARHGVSMTYDSTRDRVILWGGRDPDTGGGWHFTDTWALGSGEWINLAAQANGHGSEASIAYDEARDRVVLFGGYLLRVGSQSTTSEFDGTRWRTVTTTVNPPARDAAAMGYDPVRGRVVMFGGYVHAPPGPFSQLSDTWEYDGTEWVEVAAGGPGSIGGASMAYDRRRGRMVLYGGTPGGVASVWEYDGASWTSAPAAPLTGTGASMVYDPFREGVVMFGGNTLSSVPYFYDGSSWTVLRTEGDHPSPRLGAGMAYDVARDRVVLFGGTYTRPFERPRLLGDTWEYTWLP